MHVLSIISRGCVWEIDALVLPALLQRLKGSGSACQCSDYTPHTASNWSAWLKRKPFLKMMHKKACKQFAEDEQTKDMDLLEPCPVV